MAGHVPCRGNVLTRPADGHPVKLRSRGAAHSPLGGGAEGVQRRQRSPAAGDRRRSQAMAGQRSEVALREEEELESSAGGGVHSQSSH